MDAAPSAVGAGAAEGSLDASNILKPALARGGLLQCIGATTVEEYRKHVRGGLCVHACTQTCMHASAHGPIGVLHACVWGWHEGGLAG